MSNCVIPTTRTKKYDHRVFFTWRSCMSLVLLGRRKPIGSLLHGQYTPYDSYHTLLISLFCSFYTRAFWLNKLLLLIWPISECTCLEQINFLVKPFSFSPLSNDLADLARPRVQLSKLQFLQISVVHFLIR